MRLFICKRRHKVRAGGRVFMIVSPRQLGVRSTAAIAVFCTEVEVSKSPIKTFTYTLNSLSFELQRSQTTHLVSVFLSCEAYYIEVCIVLLRKAM